MTYFLLLLYLTSLSLNNNCADAFYYSKNKQTNKKIVIAVSVFNFTHSDGAKNCFRLVLVIQYFYLQINATVILNILTAF